MTNKTKQLQDAAAAVVLFALLFLVMSPVTAPRVRLRVVPLPLAEANQVVAAIHRHPNTSASLHWRY